MALDELGFRLNRLTYTKFTKMTYTSKPFFYLYRMFVASVITITWNYHYPNYSDQYVKVKVGQTNPNWCVWLMPITKYKKIIKQTGIFAIFFFASL